MNRRTVLQGLAAAAVAGPMGLAQGDSLDRAPAGVRAAVEQMRERLRRGMQPSVIWAGADTQGVEGALQTALRVNEPLNEMGPTTMTVLSVELPTARVAMVDLRFSRRSIMGSSVAASVWVALERRSTREAEAWVPVAVRISGVGSAPIFDGISDGRTRFI